MLHDSMSSLGGITSYEDCELEGLVEQHDVVILQPKEPIPDPLPSDWTWNGKALCLSRKVFVSCSQVLGKYHFPTVTFVGCPSLEANRDFACAVEKACKDCTKLTVVHNRDLVTTLLFLFRSLVELVLPHNMRLQSCLSESKLVNNHPVKILRGDMCGIGGNHLLLDEPTVLDLVDKCQQLEYMDINVDEVLELVPFAILGRKRNPILTLRLNNCILGSFRHRVTLDNIAVNSHVNLYTLQMVLSANKRVNHLEIVTASREVVAMIPSFESVTTLFVKFVSGGCPFTVCFPAALNKFSSLSALELRLFTEVRLSEIAKHANQLESLSLIDCWIDNEKLKPEAFENLRVLGVGNEVAFSLFSDGGLSKIMFSQLIEHCPRLKELHVSGQELCSVFLRRTFKKASLVHLKKLVLWTKQSLGELGVSVADLEALKSDLVSLKCVVTDSFDIRLFFQALHTRVKWLSCTNCVAQFSAVNGAKLVSNKFFADVA